MVKKMVLDVSEELWKEVLKYKIDKDFKTNNQAVVELLKKGLESHS